MLPSNTWNTNIYNKKLGFIIKNFTGAITWELQKKKILCSFLITIICLLPFTGNYTSTDRFYKPVKESSCL